MAGMWNNGGMGGFGPPPRQATMPWMPRPPVEQQFPGVRSIPPSHDPRMAGQTWMAQDVIPPGQGWGQGPPAEQPFPGVQPISPNMIPPSSGPARVPQTQEEFNNLRLRGMLEAARSRGNYDPMAARQAVVASRFGR